MNLESQLHEVENFASDLNIMSGFNSFLDVVRHSATVQSLLKTLDKSPTLNREAVYERLMTLFTEQSDPGYAHPYDPAIAVYLYVLYNVDEDLALKAAVQFSADPQLWWSRWLAKRIMIGDQVDIAMQSQSLTRDFVIAAPLSTKDKHQGIVYRTSITNSLTQDWRYRTGRLIMSVYTKSPIALSYVSDTARMVS